MLTTPNEPNLFDDPYLWLEGVTDPRARAWVEAENARARAQLEEQPDFAPMRQRLLEILDSGERIPAVAGMGRWCYSFWRDDQHVRGILRRTKLEEFRKPQPAWDVILDLDALAADENENWVWSGAAGLYPDYGRFLISLSRGGGDTVVVREYDAVERCFVANGFSLAPAKSSVAWIDRDTIYVCTDFGPGTLTESGYPRVVKTWRRGTPLAEATTTFEGEKTDVRVFATRYRDWIDDQIVWRDCISRHVTFYARQTYLLRDGSPQRLDVPSDARVGTFQDQILVTLKSDWTLRRGSEEVTWPRGAVLAESLSDFLAGRREWRQLHTPGQRKSLREVCTTHRYLMVHESDGMQSRVSIWSRKEGQWQCRDANLPQLGTLSIGAVNADSSDEYFFTHSDSLTPTTLSLGHADVDRCEVLKRLPAVFDSTGMNIAMGEAISKDGTRIPYCVVTPAGFKPDGTAPTLLYGYGGLEVSVLPVGYSGGIGASWLARGGVFVVAGIRGGGEFGPAWHQAALKSKRQTAYDDFIAVAEDLIARKITSPAHLGIEGGSNGGLLVAAVMVQRPELFGAVVCQVPLLDMLRYHRLLAGASWMAEFGDPDDPLEWEFISRYSPYQNVRADRSYPRVLFTTSTRDDRVHPGHARKMMARMKEQGHDVWYFESTEGGHAGAANNEQLASKLALEFTFLLKVLRSQES